jgi:hypothetical protein
MLKDPDTTIRTAAAAQREPLSVAADRRAVATLLAPYLR